MPQQSLNQQQIEDLVIQFGLLPNQIFPNFPAPNPIIIQQFESQSKTNNLSSIFND
jgi:hypothetical protein